MTDAVVHMLELYWPIWVVQSLISGSVMTGVLIGLYLWQERRKMGKRRSGYATMLAVEVANISGFVDPFTKRGIGLSTKYPVGTLPSQAYDGLMSSSNIAVFDYKLQRQLRSFYSAVHGRDYVKLRQQARMLLAEVNKHVGNNPTTP